MKHQLKFVTVALSATVGLVGCNGGKNQTNIELIQNMMDQESIKSQDWDPKMGDQVQMRLPPEGTVAIGKTPYEFQNDPAGAERQVNPLSGDMSAETLALGKKSYEVYCKVCHSADGNSTTPVADKMAVKPRLLATGDVLTYSDGRIYHAITAGKGVMGSYQGQIPNAKERWAIVNYVRSLQKK